jgi:hypothetical protein
MANRIITRSGPILVKNIKSGIPTNLFTTLLSLKDVTGTPSAVNQYITWDSDQNKFTFTASTISNTVLSNLVDSAVSETVDSDYINSIVGSSVNAATLNNQPGSYYLDYNNLTNVPAAGTDSSTVSSIINEDVDKTFVDDLNIDADTLDGQHGAHYLDYNNFVNTPSIPSAYGDDDVTSLVDSAYVQARVTIPDAGTDSSTVRVLADQQIALTDIQDLANVDITGIANNQVLKWDSANSRFIPANDATSGGAGTDADTLDGQDGTYYLNYNNFSNTPNIPVLGVDYVDSAEVVSLIDSAYVQARVTIPDAGTDSATVRTIADEQIALADTHDSAAVQGQINTALAGFTSYDSAAVDAQIDSAVTQSFIDAFDTHDSALVQGQIDTTLAGDVTVGGNLTVDGYIAGPSSMTIDPATVGTDSGTLIILGNLQVEGETTTVNSTTVSISDKNIVLADSATNASQANDAGITINGANATIQYKATGDKWEFNKPLFHGTDRVLTTADDLHDSDLVQGQIDATVNALDTHDSAAVIGQINSEVDKAFVDALTIDYNTLSNKPSIPSFGTDYVDSAEVNALIAAADTHDSAATLAQINSVVNALDTHDSAAVAGQIAATSIGDLVDVFLNGGPAHNQVIKWDSDTDRFILGNDLTSGGAGTDADTLDGQDGSFYRDYNNLTNTPTIPQHGIDYVDSAITSTLIDSALNAFDAHDSAAIQAMIDVTISGTDTHDSAAVQGQIDTSLSGFTSYDSAAVDAQIDSAVTESFVRSFIDQTFIDTFDTHDSAAIQAMIDAVDTHDSAAVVGQINAVVNQAFIDQFDTHDSAAVQGQIDATVNALDTHDSAAVLGQINNTVNQSFIDALDTHDSAAVVGQINAVVNQAFIDQFDTHDSDAIQAMIDASVIDADTVDGFHANQFLRSDTDDTTTGNLTVEGNLTTSNLITFEGDSATVANLTTAIVATAAMSSVQAIEATVVSVNATSGERQVSRVLLTHDTTDTYMNEYAVINTGASDEFALDADTSGGDFRLKLDNISGNTLFAKSSITYL